VSLVEEGDIGIDVRTTSSASRDDLILHNRDWVVYIVKRGIWLDNKREWELRFLEEPVGSGYSVEG
jgi:hypothetical protein